MIRPRLSVIPSVARNLKSIVARPDSQCRASIVTKSENSGEILYVSFTFRNATLDSSTSLRSTQNDSFEAAFCSMENGVTVKYLPLSARRGRDTERGSSQFNSRRLNSYHAPPEFDRQEHMTYHRPMSGAARPAFHKGSVTICPRMSVKIYAPRPYAESWLPTGFSRIP